MQATTLIYLEQADSYLMMHRISKKQDMNRDKWIGIGGHIEEGETPEECIRRETLEETGLTLGHIDFRGMITFVSDRFGSEVMYLFHSRDFSGQPAECDEGKLEWVAKSRLSELNLWEGDYLFLDLLAQDLPWFSMKLVYEGDRLREAVLNEERIR